MENKTEQLKQSQELLKAHQTIKNLERELCLLKMSYELCKNDNDKLNEQVNNLINIVGHKYREQITVLEEALYLACEKLPFDNKYCVDFDGCEFDNPEDCLNCVMNYFKNKANKKFFGEKNECKN